MFNPSSAIFLDRDGVIVQNRSNYIRKWADVEFLPGTLEALRWLNQRQVRVFIVTNQSVVGRGLVPSEMIVDINRQIVDVISAHGGKIHDTYICPHSPAQKCDCRKPKPGLILQAKQDHDIELPDSILIGDAVSDIKAGLAAGINRVALVRTGRGSHQEQALDKLEFKPEIYADLGAALRGMF